MIANFRKHLGPHLFSKAVDLLRSIPSIACTIDPDGVERVAAVSVRVRWILGFLMMAEMLYRSNYGMGVSFSYGLLFVLLAGSNLCTHYRLRTGRTVSLRWIMAVCILDLIIVSTAVAIHGGFNHNVCYLFYYPALAACAVIFTSFRLNLALVTIVAAVYTAISLASGEGLDLAEGEEKVLLARIVVMYAVIVVVNMISSFEQNRFNEMVGRERELERARSEFSQSIHDTAAQSAHMVRLGIDTARSIAGNSNPALASTLDSTSHLTQSVIWSLRHPLNTDGIYQGLEFNRVLRSHVTTFTNVTSLPAEITQTGAEPPLSVAAKSGLFSIAHNALTNVFRHA